jgi:hypothetical protein
LALAGALGASGALGSSGAGAGAVGAGAGAGTGSATETLTLPNTKPAANTNSVALIFIVRSPCGFNKCNTQAMQTKLQFFLFYTVRGQYFY